MDKDDIPAFFPETLRRLCRTLSLDAGCLAIRPGDGEKRLHLVLRGDVSLQREILGETVTIQRAAPGDWLLAGGIGLNARDAFAFSESRSTLLAVPEDALAEHVCRQPGFAQAWCQAMGEQVARMQRRVERIGLRTATQRVIHYLMTENPCDGEELELPFTNSAWASHLGMAPETLSRSLNDMVNAGWLEVRPGRRYRLLRHGWAHRQDRSKSPDHRKEKQT